MIDAHIVMVLLLGFVTGLLIYAIHMLAIIHKCLMSPKGEGEGEKGGA